MQLFKITFPSGYQVEDILDSNLDINIALENNKVFFGTLFTLANIKKLIEKDSQDYFWATNMAILPDLKKETIVKAIKRIIDDRYTEQIFAEIGTVQSIFRNAKNFEDLPNMI